jgi:U6 snRNA-associated Sm-like protein LSm4
MRQSGVGQQIMVDTKNGESYDGNLDSIDSFMNVKLSKVIITSETGSFSKCQEAFIRGNNIKSI